MIINRRFCLVTLVRTLRLKSVKTGATTASARANPHAKMAYHAMKWFGSFAHVVVVVVVVVVFVFVVCRCRTNWQKILFFLKFS